MSLAMSREEREGFLAGLHVGVVSVADGDRGPLTVPIWYTYEPGGELRFVTDRDSAKANRIATAGRLSLCAQTEEVPYRYVSIEGPVVATNPADLERDIRPIAHRYLGPELGDEYIRQTESERTAGGSILVRVRPERWRTVDYGKQFG